MVMVLISHYKGLEPVLLLLLLHLPYKIVFYVLICSSTCYFVLLAHVLLVTQLFSPGCKSLITVLTAAVLKQSMYSGIRVRDSHKSFHFLKLNFAATNNVIFLYF